ncbi:DNA transfer protein [Sulfuricurvum sp.]|uniref:plasmid mobilization protein n=1 Tax=Sulfuricurvum sp. TaxID=2025608 RepID=UPI003565382B
MSKRKLLDIDTKRLKTITIKVNANEYKIINDKAQSHSLNTSTYLRNLAMNYPVKSMVDRQAVTALLRVNGDLGKVGGLFKMWLMRNGEYKDDFSGERTYKDIDALVNEIEKLMKDIRNDAGELMDII